MKYLNLLKDKGKVVIEMFKNLINFSYKRSKKEAIGFYLAYLLLVIVSSMLFNSMTVLIVNNNSFEFGLRLGTITAIVASVLISCLILYKKNLFGNFAYIILALLSGVLAYFGGGLLGLLPAAYFSTK